MCDLTGSCADVTCHCSHAHSHGSTLFMCDMNMVFSILLNIGLFDNHSVYSSGYLPQISMGPNLGLRSGSTLS